MYFVILTHLTVYVRQSSLLPGPQSQGMRVSYATSIYDTSNIR